LADLVRRESCADVARAIDLGAEVRLGSSELNAGGRKRMAVLADVCEALIGAVFLDGGYPAAAALIERLWHDRMMTPVRPLRDPKTMLQEWAQGRGLPAPTYREIERKGPDHNPVFRVAVDVAKLEPAEGTGRSKRAAEQAAAAAILSRRGVNANG
jgi:ribonuclease-3